MSGPEYPDAPPPEVPEEFAAAYREAYQRALEAEPYADAEPDLPDVPPQEVVLVGTHRSDHEVVEPAVSLLTRWRAAAWFVPALFAAGALVLVLGAYAVGSALSDGGPESDGAATAASATRTTEPARGSSPSKSASSEPTTSPGGWDGPVDEVTVDAISADCTAPASNDSDGRRVTYVPKNATDGKAQTAWRCSGTAVGQKLTLRLGGDTDVAEVGLIPGYAKTDPASGVDRYAENNRITKVRWTLADGMSIVQRLDPDPSSRAMQLLRVPRTTTDTVTLEILAVKHGSRNTSAISEISLAEAAS